MVRRQLRVLKLGDHGKGITGGPRHGQTLDLHEGCPVRAVGGQLAVPVGQCLPSGVEQPTDDCLTDAVGGGEDWVVLQAIVGGLAVGAGHP